MRFNRARRTSLAIGLLTFFAPAIAAAQSVEAFYHAHPLTIVVGLPAGAAYDVYARAVAHYFSKHMAGNPTVVVQNMPGAGSLTSMNYLYNVAPKDGSMIATFVRGLVTQPLFDDQGIRFDAQKFNWIGSPSSEISIVVSWATTNIKTLDDAKTKDVVVGGSTPGADNVVFPAVLNAVLHTKFKVVTGYPGAADSLLAMERGEIDGTSTSWANIGTGHRDWLRDKKINLLVQLSTKKREDVDAPLVMDLTNNATDKQMMTLFFARNALGYPIAAPPDTPADRVDALRAAFDATVVDPDFLADMKQAGLDVAPTNGKDLAKLVADVYATPKAIVDQARAMIAGK
jgi:tripartite-type tricarboxylate transporter receptor subunit TctC